MDNFNPNDAPQFFDLGKDRLNQFSEVNERKITLGVLVYGHGSKDCNVNAARINESHRHSCAQIKIFESYCQWQQKMRPLRKFRPKGRVGLKRQASNVAT